VINSTRQFPSSDPMIGRTIAQYRIVEKLGEGGMGVVYKAEDTKLHRFVALKFLSQQFTSEEQKTRFLREAEITAQLNHPAICPIYEVGEQDGHVFFAMAIVAGRTLEQVLADGPLEVPRATYIAAQVADGLEEAHRCDVTHRDITSRNIVVGARDRAVILDFGLARAAGRSRLTQTGTRMGTAEYMSPEQTQGQPVDHRSDIWSLGVLLYEMLSGHTPFAADYELATAYSIVNETQKPLTEVISDIPAELANTVDRALAKDPEKRFATVGEFRDELTKWMPRGVSGISYPHGPQDTPAPPTPSGNRRFLAASLVMAVVAAVAAGWAIVGRGPWFGPGVPDVKNVAVIPFETFGDDPEMSALSDGLMETLTSKLSQLEQFEGKLVVVPGTEIRARNVQTVADARAIFGVNLAITGSVQRWGDRLQITANLVDARQLRQIRGNSVDFALTDLVALRDGAINEAVRLLDIELTPSAQQTLTTGQTSDASAYQSYLYGRGYVQRYDVAGNLEKAIHHFEQAIEKDAQYALAYTGLSQALRLTAHERTGEAHSDLLDRALKAAGRGVALAASASPAHAELGEVYLDLGQVGNAKAQFDKALEANPSSPDVHISLARLHETEGDHVNAEAEYRRAVELRPTNWYGYQALALYYLRVGRYGEAETAFRTALDLTPDNWLNYVNLGVVYWSMGRYAEAKDMYEQSIRVRPTSLAYLDLGTTLFSQGHYGQAAAAYEAAIDLNSESFLAWANLGDAYTQMTGRDANARQAFQRAIELISKELEARPGNYLNRVRIAKYWGYLHDTEKALAELAKLPESASHEVQVLFQTALTYELIGRRDQAVGKLREALRNGLSASQIAQEPVFNELRSNPEIAGYLEKAER